MRARITLLTAQCQHHSIPDVKLVFLDSTAVVATGPGSPAFFSRYAVDYFRSLGHEVTILDGFYPERVARQMSSSVSGRIRRHTRLQHQGCVES